MSLYTEVSLPYSRQVVHISLIMTILNDLEAICNPFTAIQDKVAKLKKWSWILCMMRSIACADFNKIDYLERDEVDKVIKGMVIYLQELIPKKR